MRSVRGGRRRIQLLAIIAVLSFAPQTPKPKPVVLHHAPHCHTRRCGRLWAEHHRKHYIYPAFALCVANHESGTGTVATRANARFDTINWQYNDGSYEGAYNWVNSTWLAMGGGRYAQHAYDASPEDQTKVFMAHANPHDWPESVPACGG